MKWKDSNDVIDSSDEAGGAYEEDYSPLKGGDFNFGARLIAVLTQPLFGIIVVAMILLILVFWKLVPDDGGGAQLAGMDQRLRQLENNMSSLEKQFEIVGDQIQTIQKLPEPMMVRLDRLETKFGRQLSDFQKELKQLRNDQTRSKPATASDKTSTKKSTRKADKTYTVQKGDTLYSISKRFGLSVSRLRKLNALSANEAIFPGQKLIVGP